MIDEGVRGNSLKGRQVSGWELAGLILIPGKLSPLNSQAATDAEGSRLKSERGEGRHASSGSWKESSISPDFFTISHNCYFIELYAIRMECEPTRERKQGRKG